jgi:tetratricopeptide (TPR) repeat protein
MAGKASVRQMQLVMDPWLEAERALGEGCKQHPHYADLHHLWGLLHLAQSAGTEAVGAFEAALAINPNYRRARFGLMAALRLRDGALDPAFWSREGPVPGHEEPEQSLWTAWFLAQRDDKEGTRRILRGLTETATWSGLAWFAMANYEAAWGDTRMSKEAYLACAMAHPLYRSILHGRGLADLPRRHGSGLVKAGMRTAGILPAWAGTVHKGATAGDPAGWNPALGELYEYLGTACARLGRPEDALPYYEEAFLRQGRESQHQIRLAHLALARGDEEEAVHTLGRAIELDPTSVPARIALGFEYQSQGYQTEALVQFEVAARLRPEYPDVQYNLGLLYQAQGRSDEALRCLHRALDVNPGYFQARTTLASILLQRESHAEALVELAPLFAHGVRSADLHVQKAQAHLALNQAQEALQELEEAIAVNPTYARTYYVLGQTYRQLGLRRKARSAWQQYLEHSRSWRDRQAAPDGEGWTQ